MRPPAPTRRRRVGTAGLPAMTGNGSGHGVGTRGIGGRERRREDLQKNPCRSPDPRSSISPAAPREEVESSPGRPRRPRRCSRRPPGQVSLVAWPSWAGPFAQAASVLAGPRRVRAAANCGRGDSSAAEVSAPLPHNGKRAPLRIEAVLLARAETAWGQTPPSGLPLSHTFSPSPPFGGGRRRAGGRPPPRCGRVGAWPWRAGGAIVAERGGAGGGMAAGRDAARRALRGGGGQKRLRPGAGWGSVGGVGRGQTGRGGRCRGAG